MSTYPTWGTDRSSCQFSELRRLTLVAFDVHDTSHLESRTASHTTIAVSEIPTTSTTFNKMNARTEWPVAEATRTDGSPTKRKQTVATAAQIAGFIQSSTVRLVKVFGGH